jgi:hypothetical protein
MWSHTCRLQGECGLIIVYVRKKKKKEIMKHTSSLADLIEGNDRLRFLDRIGCDVLEYNQVRRKQSFVR